MCRQGEPSRARRSNCEYQPAGTERRLVADPALCRRQRPARAAASAIIRRANILDLSALMRIVHHWRWLVLGAVALGLAGAILATLLTRPVYRAWVTLEANPPSFQVTEKDQDQQQVAGGDTYRFHRDAGRAALEPQRCRARRPGAEPRQQSGRGSAGSRRVEAASGRDLDRCRRPRRDPARSRAS